MGLKVKKIGTMNNSNPPSRGKPEQRYPPQLVVALLLGKGSSAIGLFFSKSLVTAPEVSANVNLAQFSSRF